MVWGGEGEEVWGRERLPGCQVVGRSVRDSGGGGGLTEKEELEEEEELKEKRGRGCVCVFL